MRLHDVHETKGEAMSLKKQPPRRAKKGTIGGKFLLPLPDDMRAAVDKAAQKEGLSTAEWIRRLIASAFGWI
jgi:predicted HicB family RNase H-like nuclease